MTQIREIEPCSPASSCWRSRCYTFPARGKLAFREYAGNESERSRNSARSGDHTGSRYGGSGPLPVPFAPSPNSHGYGERSLFGMGRPDLFRTTLPGAHGQKVKENRRQVFRGGRAPRGQRPRILRSFRDTRTGLHLLLRSPRCSRRTHQDLPGAQGLFRFSFPR